MGTGCGSSGFCFQGGGGRRERKMRKRGKMSRGVFVCKQ